MSTPIVVTLQVESVPDPLGRPRVEVRAEADRADYEVTVSVEWSDIAEGGSVAAGILVQLAPQTVDQPLSDLAEAGAEARKGAIFKRL